jgi:hypothetical protein
MRGHRVRNCINISLMISTLRVGHLGMVMFALKRGHVCSEKTKNGHASPFSEREDSLPFLFMPTKYPFAPFVLGIEDGV